MTETIVNTAEILKKYDLEVEEVEPAVYKVLNYVVTGCHYELVGKYEEGLCGDISLMNYDYADFLEPCMSTLYEKEEIKVYEYF